MSRLCGYDAGGFRLRRKIIDYNDPQDSEERRFIYDRNDQLIAEYVWDGDSWELSREYVNDANGVVCTIDYDYRDWGGYELGWHLKDHLGSTLAVVAQPVLVLPDPPAKLKVGQRILWTGKYESFGRPDNNVPVCPGGFDNPIQFTGYYNDGDVFEHYYAKARYYDPYTGRFLSRDPDDFSYDVVPTSINRYLYCGNYPLGLVDPSGEFFLTALFGFAFEFFISDVAMFGLLGGISEVMSSGDATLGDFFGGFFYGAISGAITSALSGLTVGGMSMISEGLMDSFLTSPFMEYWVKGSCFASSISDAWLVGKYPSDYGNIGRRAFPWTEHHGSSGWGAYLRMLGIGLGLNTSLAASWLPSLFLVGGSFLEYDDFAQHVIIQSFDEGAHSPVHALWGWMTGKGWHWHD